MIIRYVWKRNIDHEIELYGRQHEVDGARVFVCSALRAGLQNLEWKDWLLIYQ